MSYSGFHETVPSMKSVRRDRYIVYIKRVYTKEAGFMRPGII